MPSSIFAPLNLYKNSCIQPRNEFNFREMPVAGKSYGEFPMWFVCLYVYVYVCGSVKLF